MKLVLSLMKNLLPPLRKGLLISIGLTSTSSATDAGINKKLLESGNINNNIKRRNKIHHGSSLSKILAYW